MKIFFVASGTIILSMKQMTKVLIRLCRCTGWSAPLLSIYSKVRFFLINAQLISQFMRFWYLLHMPAAKAPMSLAIHTVSPEPSLLAHTKNGYTVKPVLRDHLKIDKTKVSTTDGSLMQVKSIAECSKRAFCNTFDLHLAIIGLENQFLVFFLIGRLRQVLLYINYVFYTHWSVMTVLKYSNDMFASCSLLVWQHAPLLSCVLHVNSNGIAFEQV